MATLGRAVRTPLLPSPPAGLGTSEAAHLLPLTWAQHLSWGRRDPAAGGLGAVSVSVVGPARGLQGATIMGGMRKGPRGLSRPVLELSWGPRSLLLVRDSSCCPRVPRFGVSVRPESGDLRPLILGAFTGWIFVS